MTTWLIRTALDGTIVGRVLEAGFRRQLEEVSEVANEIDAFDLLPGCQLADALRDSRRHLGDLSQLALAVDGDVSRSDECLDPLWEFQQLKVLADPARAFFLPSRSAICWWVVRFRSRLGSRDPGPYRPG